ncbi:MAG: GtrA family protein [Christensenellales bacterium]|jgi:putative flippase GtrA
MRKLWEKAGRLMKSEAFLYLVFGALTTLLNWGVFWLLNRCFGKSFYLWANLIAWVTAVIFAYITNRILVFRSKNRSAGSVAAEFLEFIGARLATLGIEEAGLWLLVGRLSCNENVSKVGLNVLVVILNFFFSKWIVFRKKERKPKDTEDPS